MELVAYGMQKHTNRLDMACVSRAWLIEGILDKSWAKKYFGALRQCVSHTTSGMHKTCMPWPKHVQQCYCSPQCIWLPTMC